MTIFTREDFEMAAKAAGLRVRTWEGHTGTMCAIDDDSHGRMWMPPHDDGDALRLAVKLRIEIRWGCSDGVEYVAATYENTVDLYDCEFDQDPHAATRHAIFRAAIEIGRAMP